MPEVGSDQPELTVGQLAARSGVSVSALHFYERQHLITSRRTSGNQRRYRRDTLRRVALIRVAQRVGIPLADIRAALAELPDNRTPARADWRRLSERWRADLDRRIRALQQLRDDFTDCIGCGCLSLDRCALANPGDQLGQKGAGPRRLLDRAEPDTPTADTPTADTPDPGTPGAGTADTSTADTSTPDAGTPEPTPGSCGRDVDVVLPLPSRRLAVAPPAGQCR